MSILTNIKYRHLNGPYIKDIDYSYFTHVDWNYGRRTETLILTIATNGANAITLNLSEDTTEPTYATAGSATISSVINGTFSGTTIIPKNSNTDVIVAVDVTCGRVNSSGATFNRHISIYSYY